MHAGAVELIATCMAEGAAAFALHFRGGDDEKFARERKDEAATEMLLPPRGRARPLAVLAEHVEVGFHLIGKTEDAIQPPFGAGDIPISDAKRSG